MLEIRRFRTEDQAAVKNLILDGLAEHWGRLDRSKNPDLNDIASSYAGATFLVAWLDGKIVGSGALKPHDAQTAEVVRMSVDKTLRRQGIGRAVLQALISEARAGGFQRVILETTAAWEEVVRFYLDFGFHITHYQDEDVYFVLELSQTLSKENTYERTAQNL